MAIERVIYTDLSNNVVSVLIDETRWDGVHLDTQGEIVDQVKEWLAEGNTPEPYTAGLNPIAEAANG